MTHLPRRARAALTAVLATLLLGLAVPGANASVPRATTYHAGGAITLDTNLLSASGATAWAIDEFLAASTPLPPLGASFLGAEQRYGVNARFLLAAAMLESGWGRSDIARLKHNLFGYNAYDRDPFRYATAFGSFAANIDATAKFMRDFYLTPGARWWGGAPTLRGMQLRWSSSGQWGAHVSWIASTIRLDGFDGSAHRFAAPAVSGPLHGGDTATVSLAWTGGPVPPTMAFSATWVPVALDADLIAAASASAIPSAPAPAGAPSAGTAPSSTASAAPTATAPSATAPSMGPTTPGGPVAAPPPEPIAAERKTSDAREIGLAIAAPSQPGLYLLQVDMLDADGTALPSGERVTIPPAQVRVWGDLAISVGVQSGGAGVSASVTVTNTGRVAIPALPDPVLAAADPEGGFGRSVVTVIASPSSTPGTGPTLLISMPLSADLLPGETVTYSLPDIEPFTGQTVNWVTIRVSVLGDETRLAAYAPAGGWVSAATATGEVVLMQPASRYEGPPDPAGSSGAVSSPSPGASSAPAGLPAPSAPPVPTASPAPQHVTQTIEEWSGAIAYQGSWGSAAGAYLDGHVAYATDAGAAATLAFTGDAVRWVGPLGPTRGAAQVLLDGRAVTTVNLWRPGFVPQATIYARSFASSGRHTLTIRVLPAPGHPYVAIDAFVIRS